MDPIDLCVLGREVLDAESHVVDMHLPDATHREIAACPDPGGLA